MLRTLLEFVRRPFGAHDLASDTKIDPAVRPLGDIDITVEADGALCIQPHGHGMLSICAYPCS